MYRTVNKAGKAFFALTQSLVSQMKDQRELKYLYVLSDCVQLCINPLEAFYGGCIYYYYYFNLNMATSIFQSPLSPCFFIPLPAL